MRPAPLQPPALSLHNLTLGYARHPAVHHVSVEIAPASLVSIVGPNGGGKSTLLKALAGQMPPMEGSIAGLEGRRVAYLPQTALADREFPIQVFDFVTMGLWHRLGVWSGVDARLSALCHEALHAVGLEGFERRALDSLSGGQFQRALFARLMLQDADLVLLDEPFAAIDQRTTQDLFVLLNQWRGQGKTVLIVSHDLQLAKTVSSHVMLLARELVAWGAPADVLTAPNLQRASRMTEAWDEFADACIRTPGAELLQMQEART